MSFNFLQFLPFLQKILLLTFISHITLGQNLINSYIINDFDRKALLDIHNEERALVCLSKLTWDSEIANIAKSYSSQCRMAHSGNGYGENLFGGSLPFATIRRAIYSWTDEKFIWMCGQCCDGATGHYTQIVWEDTEKIGCGASICEFNGVQMLWVVCNYSPSGNSRSPPFPIENCNGNCNTTSSPTRPPTPSPTRPLTLSPTSPPTPSPTSPLTPSPTSPPTPSTTHPPTSSPTSPPTPSLTRPLTPSPTHPPSASPTSPPTRLPTALPTTGQMTSIISPTLSHQFYSSTVPTIASTSTNITLEPTPSSTDKDDSKDEIGNGQKLLVLSIVLLVIACVLFAVVMICCVDSHFMELNAQHQLYIMSSLQAPTINSRDVKFFDEENSDQFTASGYDNLERGIRGIREINVNEDSDSEEEFVNIIMGMNPRIRKSEVRRKLRIQHH